MRTTIPLTRLGRCDNFSDTEGYSAPRTCDLRGRMIIANDAEHLMPDRDTALDDELKALNGTVTNFAYSCVRDSRVREQSAI